MKITTTAGLDQKADVLVLGILDETKTLKNSVLQKDLEDALKEKVLHKEKFGEVFVTKNNGLPYHNVVFLALGKKKELTLEKVRRALGKAVKAVRTLRQPSFTTDILDLVKDQFDAEQLGTAAAESLLLANYSFIKYLSEERKEKITLLEMVSLQWSGNVAALGSGLKIGRVIGESSNFVRDLVNDSASVVNSVYMEKIAKQVAASSPKISMKVLGEAEMKKLGMGSLLGVNLGSANPPKLILLEYKGGSGKPVALVGKGITFDSGGYNLKPTKYIEDMKTDMAGSAAVLGTIKAAAQLGIKKNILGVMPMCENMVSSHAQRPGDIVKAYNGKTIEIGNTDAEGRLVLADAMAYADDKYNPEYMVTLATLTGACVVALGYYAAAVMGKDDRLISSLKEAGMNSGDRVWELPFYDEYQDWMNGSISDLNNISQKGKGYEAGSVTAGVFLSKFVEKAKWAHLDIAGSAYWCVDGDYLCKGATGSGVRVLLYYLMGK
ncbi:leucyl aminopeptidase [Candidatus Woesearchaeota archaeon CG10_big_fil_rev_8_21_14_0_10_45_16]|nr:MAG: leucyl aminopeptidase [Candidatus Woesearchaeota archaeon CG10_big_fil_rev_8_21_14_0_10_45_16]